MQQPSEPSRPLDLPRSVRIMPSRSALRAGLAAGVALMFACGWLVHDPQRALPIALIWILLGLAALTAIGSAARLLVLLPVIVASEIGIAIWPYGPYQQPFFAPWSRVRAVALTRVRPRGAPRTAPARDALGIELIHDDPSGLAPAAASTERPIEGAARADLAWSSRVISGDPARWVALLQTMKAAYEESRPPDR
ncbi:MAG TPA: hypothetical protein VH278_06350 [Burkholderiaceae bacterium]|nr:hypothetical protein [Burkholderiaceae bacterium]